MIILKKIYDELLRKDERIKGKKPDCYKTIYENSMHRVDINLYLTDPETNYYISTIRVIYKNDNLDTETGYDYGIPPTRDQEKILEIIQNGIENIWGGPSHFIEFNKLLLENEG